MQYAQISLQLNKFFTNTEYIHLIHNNMLCLDWIYSVFLLYINATGMIFQKLGSVNQI